MSNTILSYFIRFAVVCCSLRQPSVPALPRATRMRRGTANR